MTNLDPASPTVSLLGAGGGGLCGLAVGHAALRLFPETEKAWLLVCALVATATLTVALAVLAVAVVADDHRGFSR